MSKNPKIMTCIETAEQINQAIYKIDLCIRPYAVFCHPCVAELLNENTKKNIKIVETSCLPPDRAYIVNREEFNKLMLDPLMGV